MKGKIVVATDGSDTGNRALDLAAKLSSNFEQGLCIVHVLMYGRPAREFAEMAEVEGLVPPASTTTATERRPTHPLPSGLFAAAEDEVAIARKVSALGEHIIELAKDRCVEAGAKDVTATICAGDIADEILDVAEAEQADTIVMGRRGLGRLREVLLGSVSQKVLHHAHCTVIIVH